MNRLFKILAATVLFSFILGCNPIEGEINVITAFKAISIDNRCDSNLPPNCHHDQTIQIPAGKFPVKFEIKSKQEAQLTIDTGHQNQSISLRIPSGKSFPENGTLTLSAGESGQPFNLVANVKTTVVNSENRSGVENCQIQWQETECSVYGNPPQQYCRTVTRYRQGRRNVQYYVQTTDKLVATQFSSTKDPNQIFAQFNGEQKGSERIYTYDSGCW